MAQAAFAVLAPASRGQMIDQAQAPNAAKDGIHKSLMDQIGAGRGDGMTLEGENQRAIVEFRAGASRRTTGFQSRSRDRGGEFPQVGQAASS